MSGDNKAPCKGCPDRLVTEDFNCHTNCQKYREFQQWIREKNRYRMQDASVVSYYLDKKERIRKKEAQRFRLIRYRSRMK